MNIHPHRPHAQGFFLLEALLAVLIFSLGVLAMVAMGATAINAQGDAQYRNDAATFANEIATQIWLNVPRTQASAHTPSATRDAAIAAALTANFQHQPTTNSTASGVPCKFSGGAATSPIVTSWVDEVVSGPHALPGATREMQQILVDTSNAGNNMVTIIVCWRAPSDKFERKHTLITYING